MQVLNKLRPPPTFIHPLPIHITFNKSDLIQEFGSDFKEVSVSDDADVRMKAFHRNLKGARYKDQEPRGHAPGGAFETRFRDDKDSPEITKIPERVRVHTNDRRYIESRSIVSYMPYPNGSKGPKEARSLCPQATHGHSTCIRRALYDHVDLDTLSGNRYRSDLS